MQNVIGFQNLDGVMLKCFQKIQDVSKTIMRWLKSNLSRPKIKYILLILVAIFGLAIASPSSAGVINTKLNDEMPPVGDVSFFSLSPDSTRLVYRADQDTDDVDELFRGPLGGGDCYQAKRHFAQRWR